MSDQRPPETGDRLTVTVARRRGAPVVVDSDTVYDCVVVGEVAVEDGATREITAEVTRTVLSRGGSVEKLLVGETDATGRGPSSNEATRSRNADGSTQGQGADADAGDSLDQIADELVGDHDLETSGEEESTVSAAKRRAKRQQRDPAIDPTFQGG